MMLWVRKNLKPLETTVVGTVDNPKRNCQSGGAKKGGLKRDTEEKEKSKRKGKRLTRIKDLIRKRNYNIQAER